MKLYITKPKHTKYGLIKLENPFNSIDELIEDCLVWFKKPSFEKPFIDIFGDAFCWRGWVSIYRCQIPFKYFPEGEVKDKIRSIIKESITSNFHEAFYNRHYKWVGEVGVDLIRRNTEGDFNLYLIKPASAWDVVYAGIDRAKIFLSKPNQKDLDEAVYYIEGRVFRKNEELNPLCMEMWDEVQNSFTIPPEDFFYNLNDTHHKENQGPTEFIRNFFFDLKLKENL